MAIAQLTIDINARMASIEKDMGRLAQIANRRAEEMRRSFEAVGAALAATFAGVSLAGVTASFRGLVDQLDALNDTADSTGSSIENISALEDIAKRTGGSLEDVTSILVKFNGVLKEADGKNGVSQALKAIGLDAAELRQIDPAEALQRTAVALAAFADDGNKARLVQELFGKSVKEAAPFLKDLADQGKLNAKYTAEQAAAAETFNKQLSALSTSINGVAKDLAGKLLPAINSYLEKVRGLGNFGKLNGAADDARAYSAAIKDVVDEIALLDQKLQGDPSNSYYKARLAELRKEYVLLQREAGKATDRLKGVAGVGLTESGVSAGVSDSKPSVGNIADKLGSSNSRRDSAANRVPDIQREIEALQRKLQTVQQLTEVESLLADFESGKFKATAPELGRAVALAEEIDKIRELAKASEAASKAKAEQTRAQMQLEQEADQYFRASLTQQEKLEATVKRINELYEKGAFGTKGTTEAIEKQARAIKAASDESSKLNEAARDMADIFTRAAESGDNLGKALETIIKKRLVFEPMAKALEAGFQSLFSLAGGLFGAGGSSSSSGPGLKAPSSTVSTFGLPGHADGLSYVPYDNYVARLHKGERVLTAKENAQYGSAGGITVVNHNTIGSGVSRAEVAAAMEMARRETMAAILESKRNRGAFA